jgi:hypothetical protein
MSDTTAAERVDARVQEPADDAEHILSEANDVVAPPGRGLRDTLIRVACEAPLHSLVLALLLRAIIARGASDACEPADREYLR